MLMWTFPWKRILVDVLTWNLLPGLNYEMLSGREKLLNNFKELWNEEYLLSLRESCKDLHNMDFNNKIQINDVVLIKNPAKTWEGNKTFPRMVIYILCK